jgi:hypothetical protein
MLAHTDLCAGERDHATGPVESTIENAAKQTPVPAPPRKIEAPVTVAELKRAAKNYRRCGSKLTSAFGCPCAAMPSMVLHRYREVVGAAT